MKINLTAKENTIISLVRGNSNAIFSNFVSLLENYELKKKNPARVQFFMNYLLINTISNDKMDLMLYLTRKEGVKADITHNSCYPFQIACLHEKPDFINYFLDKKLYKEPSVDHFLSNYSFNNQEKIIDTIKILKEKDLLNEDILSNHNNKNIFKV